MSQEIPAVLNMRIERVGFVLGKNTDATDTGMNAIGQTEINRAVFSRKIDSGFSVLLRE